jgi:LRR receptor-like serine/threonine-protein kinase FLS2
LCPDLPVGICERKEFLFFQATAFAGDLPRLPPNIFELDCSFSLISGGLINENFEGLDELNWMLLDGNAFNSSVPSVFGSLPNLEFLYISDSFISGDLSYMEGMPKIIEHWIDVNPGLTGPIFPFIGDLDTLISFSVTQNSITGQLPAELSNLSGMLQMWFYANFLTGQIPSAYGGLRQMSTLQLEGNAFTGSMPAEICANTEFLQPLTTLGADCGDPNFDVSYNVPVQLRIARCRQLRFLVFPCQCSCCTCCSLTLCNPQLSG